MRRSPVPLLALRFLFSKSSDRFLSFIAWVSVTGVALGVLSLVVVTSVINGFEDELTRVITGMNSDVVLYSRADPVSDPEKIEQKIREVLPEARAVSRSFVTELMASGPSGVAGSLLEGIDLATIGDVTVIPKRVISGALPMRDGEVALGSAIADKIGAKAGAEIRLIAPFMGQGSEAPLVWNVRVSGIVKMGMYEYDSKLVYAPLASVQTFLKQPGRVTSFKMRLAPKMNSRMAADRLSESFGFPFRAKDWTQLNKNLFYAIALEKIVIAILLTAIVIVAAFNVVSTLMMMIHDKTREIAILKAMGLRPHQCLNLFALTGTGIGVVGTAIGVGLGLLVNFILDRTHLIDLPAEIYYIGYLPVVFRWNEMVMIAFVALFVTFVATLYPAFQVSRKPPLEGLRYD